MAEQISKNCWATPKCGLSTAEKLFKQFNSDSNFTFIFVRNPYKRIVSFYINKIIYQADPPWEIKDHYLTEIVIPHLEQADTSISFEQFVNILNKINVMTAERHLKPQFIGVLTKQFDKEVKLENYKEDMQVVCEQLNFDYELATSKESRINFFERTDSIDFYIGDKPTSWFRNNGVPKNWKLFYNENTLRIISQKYKTDFERFGYTILETVS